MREGDLQWRRGIGAPCRADPSRSTSTSPTVHPNRQPPPAPATVSPFCNRACKCHLMGAFKVGVPGRIQREEEFTFAVDLPNHCQDSRIHCHDFQTDATPIWSMTHFDVFLNVNSTRFVGKLTSKVNFLSEYATKILLVVWCKIIGLIWVLVHSRVVLGLVKYLVKSRPERVVCERNRL